MRLIRDIDVFNDPAILSDMVASSLEVTGIGLGILVAWVVLGWPHEGTDVIWFLIVAISLVSAFALHELVHGLFFKIFGGKEAHLRFGARDGMLYSCAAGLVLPRREFLVVLLAPTVLVSAIVFFAAPALELRLGGFVVFAMHLSGCTGDLAFVAAILDDPEVTKVEDTEDGIRLYGED